jgi:glycosyltransferase involved in cell wall biosynthesis
MAGSVGLIAQEDPGREERTSGQRVHVPPVVPPAFGPERQLRDHKAAKLQGLPSAYVLSVCGCPEDAGLLLAAWTWVASAIGDRIALAVMAGSQTARQIQAGLGRLGLEGSVAVLEAHRGDDLPAIYGNAEAFLFAGWGRIEEAVRRALAAGLPIVGSQTAESARVVGDAGYLVPRRDARLLGAACLTVLVETTVADRLREAAERRGAPLMSEAPLLMCLSCLERVAAMG